MITYTESLVNIINEYLEQEGLYKRIENNSEINNAVLSMWKNQFANALTNDFKQAYPNLIFQITLAEFDIISDDDRGATLFYHRATLIDELYGEELLIYIKTLVNYAITFIHPQGVYSNMTDWQGNSIPLKRIFNKISTNQSKSSYFSPKSWQEFILK